MGYYTEKGYVYEPTDAGAGICDESVYRKQQREKQKKLDEENAGEIGSEIKPEPQKK